jgi:hypothetical protein
VDQPPHAARMISTTGTTQNRTIIGISLQAFEPAAGVYRNRASQRVAREKERVAVPVITVHLPELAHSGFPLPCSCRVLGVGFQSPAVCRGREESTNRDARGCRAARARSGLVRYRKVARVGGSWPLVSLSAHTAGSLLSEFFRPGSLSPRLWSPVLPCGSHPWWLALPGIGYSGNRQRRLASTPFRCQRTSELLLSLEIGTRNVF